MFTGKEKEKRWAYYSDGVLYDVKPRNESLSLYDDRDTAYKADFIVSDGEIHDLNDSGSVQTIKIPKFNHSDEVVFNLAYIMKMRCGTIKDPNLIPTFVRKTLSLMLFSHIGWRASDYLQVLRNYYRCGHFREGDYYERYFRAKYWTIFKDPSMPQYDLEHQRTKEYFKNKWMKNHPSDDVNRPI